MENDMAKAASAARALVKEHNVLLTLPEVCLRLRGLLDEPTHTRRQVAELILHDPALTARLLRIVNSAWYGLPQPVRDISQALGIIGEHELHHLAVVTTIVRNTAGLQPGFDLAQFWQRSIFAAALARQLQPWCRELRREELFLAGLLLDIGKPLLYTREHRLYATVKAQMDSSGRADFEVERELLGFDHAHVGAALAAHWNFPLYLQQLILGHHDPEQKAPGLPLLQAVARCICEAEPAGVHADPAALLQHCEPHFSAVLPLAEGELATILQAASEDYRQAHESFCGGRE